MVAWVHSTSLRIPHLHLRVVRHVRFFRCSLRMTFNETRDPNFLGGNQIGANRGRGCASYLVHRHQLSEANILSKPMRNTPGCNFKVMSSNSRSSIQHYGCQIGTISTMSVGNMNATSEATETQTYRSKRSWHGACLGNRYMLLLSLLHVSLNR